MFNVPSNMLGFTAAELYHCKNFTRKQINSN